MYFVDPLRRRRPNRGPDQVSYTGLRIARSAAAAFILISVASGLFAVEQRYQVATILKIEQKSNTRVLYYVVNTPITKEEPYYEVSLRSKDEIYVARYTPRHQDDTLPSDWSAGSSVQLRVDGRHVFVKRSGGGDVQLVITKHRKANAEDTVAPPASAEK